MHLGTDILESYFRDVRRFAPLRRDQERSLGRRFRRGDAAAGKALVTANLRFVVKIAGEFRSTGLSVADLVQEGNLGLMKAVSKFDPERGLRLISYAVWWIRAYIQAYVLRSWSLVKMGTTQAQRRLFQTLSRERRALPQHGIDEEPDDEELARRLSVKPCEVVEMKTRMSSRDVSLDAPLNGNATFSLINFQKNRWRAPRSSSRGSRMSAAAPGRSMSPCPDWTSVSGSSSSVAP
jgi:RNA polymerase sigma-32 factor